ncbi:MAG: helix-turn-helix domain-containing protein [Pseudomonadota bacterium]
MRKRLVVAARALFIEEGFTGTSTPEIVKRAEVTRGALYHHFSDKSELFQAVVAVEAASVAAAIEADAGMAEDAETALRLGADAYFEAMKVEGRARLLLIDGPAVLGPDTMDKIDGGAGRASLASGLAALRPDLDTGILAALTMLLSSAFDRAAQDIAMGGDQGKNRQAIGLPLSGISSGKST